MIENPCKAPPPSPATPARAATTGRVRWTEKLAYGIGGLPVQFGEAGMKTLAVPVYQMMLKIDPALLGLAMAVPRLIDAFTDPLIGHVSDRTRGRWGRRRPYIVGGALLSGLSFIIIWMVPVNWTHNAQLWWFLGTSVLFYLCNSVWAVPYQSLGYEVSPDYNERTGIMGMQAVFYKLASLLYQWIFPLAQLAIFASVMDGIRTVTVFVAVAVFILAGGLPGFLVRERFVLPNDRREPNKPRFNFLTACSTVLRNRSMLIIASLVTLQTIAGMLCGNLDYYLIVYYMSGGDLAQGSVWKGWLSSGYAVVGFLSIWPAVQLSRRLGKRATLSIIYGMAVVGGALKWLVFNPHWPWLIMLDPLLCAPVYVGLSVLVPSMMADICDEDELLHGERREGLFGAMLSWIRKFGVSLAFLGSGLTLNLIGFDAALEGAQHPSAILGIRLVMSLATSGTSVIALLLLRSYYLDRTRAAAIRVELEARRGAAI